VHPEVAAAFVLATTASVLCAVFATRLGYTQSAASLGDALGGHLEGERCHVVYAQALRRPDLERFTHDCDAHVVAGERWLGAPGPRTISVFVFESAAQKGALMGAADTFFAKPWRREVYVQAEGYPHPAIGHELIHVLAGQFGRGPFRVAGDWGGFLPNPGLIEGVAVAAEPKSGDLTPAEWAKAMKDLGLLPRLPTLFALGFLGENMSVAYTVSGAFVGWIHDGYGPATVRAWYGGTPLPSLTGASWAQLEHAWHDGLDRIVLREAALVQARAKFEHPAVFGRRCPHTIDACEARAARLSASSDYGGALAAYAEVLALDPDDIGVAIAMAKVRARAGAPGEAKDALARISGDVHVSRALRDRALEDLMDLELAHGDPARAADGYTDLLSRTVDEDRLRTLDIKIAAARDERGRRVVVSLLIGVGARPPDRVLAAELLRGWADTPPSDGLPWYLLGRQSLGEGLLEEAKDRLDRALAEPIAVPRVRVEAERLRLVLACSLGDPEGARQAFKTYAAHPEVSVSRREGARALLERCTGAQDLPRGE
jgi:hypothetical protein